MPTTYILLCADQTLYIGSTNDLERRLRDHNHGKAGAHYTKIRRPVNLVWKEEFGSLKEARAREVVLKRLSRKEKLVMIGMGGKNN
ncbi:MAG: GIY-YIG nuclease family protein [Candidatus Paceibacterota bacterium]